ncbi:MAG: sugar phosphate isomerase/epimerase family protein [Sphaerochaeta sp.]
MMTLSLMTDALSCLPFLDMVKKAKEMGIQQLEFATGNWSKAPHLHLDTLIESPDARQEFLGVLREYGLSISALNCSGNHLAPNALGARHLLLVHKTFTLASLLGVKKIVMMSGLPGACEEDASPNWITTSWPPENLQMLDWQWRERLIPSWHSLIKRAQDCNIEAIALENHGSQLVYNADTLKQLREAVGPMIGMNLDPSHLFWMGGDPRAMARSLGPMIYHVHAKDVRIEEGQFQVRGLLDTQPIEAYATRSWNYVALGYGHDLSWWKEFFSVLAMVGYDGPISLEMEDMTMDQITGVTKSIELLKAAMPRCWE